MTINKPLSFVIVMWDQSQRWVSFVHSLTLISAPRMIQNITIIPNMTSVLISWDTQEGPELNIDMEYVVEFAINSL